MRTLLCAFLVAGGLGGAAGAIVEQQADRVLLRTSVGSFETRQLDLPPELLEAVLGGPASKGVFAVDDRAPVPAAR